MKRAMLLTVLDKHGAEWCFEVREDPAHLSVWRAVGFDVVIIDARIPAWAVSAGLARPWAAVYAAWQWLRLL